VQGRQLLIRITANFAAGAIEKPPFNLDELRSNPQVNGPQVAFDHTLAQAKPVAGRHLGFHGEIGQMRNGFSPKLKIA
jgi:hypothetical protein